MFRKGVGKGAWWLPAGGIHASQGTFSSMMNGLADHYYFGESTFIFRCIRRGIKLLFHFWMHYYFGESIFIFRCIRRGIKLLFHFWMNFT